MLKVKAVIFDMDGLMIDTEPVGNKCCVEANKQFGYKITRVDLDNLTGTNTQSAKDYYFKTFGEDYPFDTIREVSHKMYVEYFEEHEIPVKPGLYALLDDLKAKGIKMAVASSTKTDRVLHNLKRIKVDHYFETIIGGEQITNGKPAPDIFLKALDLLGVEANEAVVLEDSKNGIIASYKADIPVICVPDLVKHTQETIDLTYKVCHDLYEVKDILEAK